MPHKFQVLTPEQAQHFVEKGYVLVKGCLDPELAEKWKAEAYVRLGYDPNDRSTWTKEIVWMDRNNVASIKDLSPKAWGALCDVTGVPEKFAGLPLGTRAIQLPDGEVNNAFLKTFGQPARELACECERESDGNLAQALQLINGPTVNGKIRDPKNRLGTLLGGKMTDAEVLTDLYYTALSRAPFDDEKEIALGHVAKASDKRKAWEDVLWAIINTREFLFRH